MKSLKTTKKLDFKKYVATGNDFIVVEKGFDPNWVKPFCHRRYGIGADGVLWVQKSSVADCKMVYFNSDGNRAKMCLNGLRTLFFHTGAKSIETDNGIYFGEKESVCLPAHTLVRGRFEVEGVLGDHYFTGVDHFVVEGFEHFAKAKQLRIATGANVNCFERASEGKIYVRTFERGVEDETYSCGTGAYACYAKCCQSNLLIEYPQGDQLYFSKEKNGVMMRGEVVKVFEGVINPSYV